MPEKKRQHIVAQSYLSNFTNEPKNKGQSIWVYDKGKKLLYKKGISNITVEPYAYSRILEDGSYDHHLEDELSKLETRMASLIRKIERNNRLFESQKNIHQYSNEDKSVITEFVFWQWMRGGKSFEKMLENLLKKSKDIHEKYKIPFTKKNKQDLKIDSLFSLGSGIEGKSKINLFEVLFKKKFLFASLNEAKTSFITGDNPLVSFNRNQSAGWVYDDTEIYFPLTQKTVLVLHERSEVDDLVHIKSLNRREIFNLNLVIASGSNKYFFGRDKALLEKIVSRLNMPHPTHTLTPNS